MIPSFEGSSKSTTTTWVHKLDTYFYLNLMTWEEEIKFSTLHLDGEAHEWWYHGLVMMDHSNITSYVYFTHRLMDRFDMKDPEIHFRELVQLRKTNTPEAYIIEFHRMVVMVTDILEQRLVMLWGWLNSFKPIRLQDVIMKI